RALAQQAPLLLLDEPTTHLDLAYQVSLMDSIRDLAHPASRGGDSPAALGALVVMHDLHLVARYADRVALLVNGRLAALGYPAEVLTPEQVSSGFGLPQATVEELLHQPAAVANSLPG
ncbi:MAG TPA: ABC transporter ATP-binding protein, partial [Anaerolineaceae bacterium]|nr:ABC transporter ATP-binding protein [Anaerolineaceae bacterium]